jgi:hypothetical protein
MFGLKGIEMEEKRKTKKREGEILGGRGWGIFERCMHVIV